MASRRERRGPNRPASIRPLLLAAGLGLIWFAKFQDNTPPSGASDWAIGAVLGSRLVADVVGALVALSLLRLVLTLTRLLVVRWRLQRQLEVR